jgi:hypothetical protein
VSPDDGSVRLWDSAGRPLRVLRGPAGSTLLVAWTPDSQRFATAGTDGKVRLWDAATGRLLRDLAGHKAGILTRADSLAFSPDGLHLALGGRELGPHKGSLCLWDVNEDRPPRSLGGDAHLVFGVAFHPLRPQLVSTDLEGIVRVWDFTTESGPRQFKRDVAPLYGVAYSPDGNRLATFGYNGDVLLWNVTERLVERTLKGHIGQARGVAFSPDGQRLATGGYDGTIRLWDPTTGAELCMLRTGPDRVTCVSFSPDGTRLAFPGPDGDVRIADARPRGPEVQVEQEALDLVDCLFARPLLKDAVLEQIHGHKTLGEPVRRLARELADRYADEPDRFRHAARTVVRERNVAPGLYRLAVRWAETACRLAPEEGDCLSTLGMAQYRVGRHAEARATLAKAERLNKTSRPAEAAFQAMAQHRLGHCDQAKAALARLHELLKRPANADVESLALVAEAEEVLQGPTGTEAR